MKKILLTIALLAIPFICFAAYTGGWNYVYHNGQNACLSTSKTGITVASLLNAGCHIESVDKRQGTVMILNCKDHPEIQSYVWFGRTLSACEWIKNQ